MGSPAKGAHSLLNIAAITADGWTVVYSRLTPDPDKLIAVLDSGGLTPHPARLYDQRTIQCLIRGAADKYDATYAKALLVRDRLLGLPSQLVLGDWWAGVVGLGDIAHVSYANENRPVFSVNFRIMMEPAETVLSHREPL
jgi:hypothetical protein